LFFEKQKLKKLILERLEEFLLVKVVIVLRSFRFTGLGCSDRGGNPLISTQPHCKKCKLFV